MFKRRQRILIIGSNILGNSTASRRFKEAIESLPGTEITCVTIAQSDIESSRLPALFRRYQLIPTYLILRKQLCELAQRSPEFDLILVITCQPLTALQGLWPQARIALWFDSLPHHPGGGIRATVLNTAVSFLYQSAFSRVQYLLPMSNWAKQQSLGFTFPALRSMVLSPTRVSRKIWENHQPLRATPNQVIRVLLVGNNANGKGFIDFFRWCKTEYKDLSRFHFTIVSNEGNITLKKMTHGVSVEFEENLNHGDLPRLASLYHTSHLCFLPTKADMMPNVLIEATASQLPCIASRLGAIDEVVCDGRTGWLVEPLQWGLFYERLQAFAAKPDQFKDKDLYENAERFFDERMQDDLNYIIFEGNENGRLRS